jgi:hypothetical protein
MPVFTFVIDGQRHAFEGPDQQTAARFAQRWADQSAGRAPVTVQDIQQRLGPKPSNLSMDLNSRARGDIGDLNAAIADARAHPGSLLNAPKILGAVARYVPNAVGLAPAGGVDQVTGPIVRGINSRFGTDYNPHDVTDQILNAAGLIAGGAEATPAGRTLRSTSGAIDPAASEAATAHVLPARSASGTTEALADEIGRGVGGRATNLPSGQPSPSGAPAGRGPPILRLVPHSDPGGPMANLPSRGGAPPNLQLISGGPVRPNGVMIAKPTAEFEAKLDQNLHSLSDLPPDIQDEFKSSVNDIIYGPLLDDPDFQGYDAEHASNIGSQLSDLANQYRDQGGLYSRLPDISDRINGDFSAMIDGQRSGGIATKGRQSAGGDNGVVVNMPSRRSPNNGSSIVPGLSQGDLNQILNMDENDRQGLLDRWRMLTPQANATLPDGVINLIQRLPPRRAPVPGGWNENPPPPTQFPNTSQRLPDPSAALPAPGPVTDASAPNAFKSSDAWSNLAAAIAARMPRSISGLDFTNLGSNAMIPAILAATAPQGAQVGQQGQ